MLLASYCHLILLKVKTKTPPPGDLGGDRIGPGPHLGDQQGQQAQVQTAEGGGEGDAMIEWKVGQVFCFF